MPNSSFGYSLATVLDCTAVQWHCTAVQCCYSLDCTAVQCDTVPRYSLGLYRHCTPFGWKLSEKREQDPSGHAGKFRKCSTRVPSKYPTFGAVLINLSGSTDLKTTFFIKIIAFWVKSSKIRDYEAKIATQKKNRGPKKISFKKSKVYTYRRNIFNGELPTPAELGERAERAKSFFWSQKRLASAFDELAL